MNAANRLVDVLLTNSAAFSWPCRDLAHHQDGLVCGSFFWNSVRGR